MKNLKRHFPLVTGSLAIIISIVLTFTACDNGTTGGGGGRGGGVIPATVATAKESLPNGTELESGATVTLSTTTAGAEIWYTTNGSAPAKNGVGSTRYIGPIPITADVTIKAIAVKDGMNDSGVMSVTYTVTATGAVTRPIASPAGGAVSAGTTVTLSTATADAEIWYTTNGSDPAKDGADSTKYANPIPITAAVTIKAIAV
jgi:N-acetyl-beta-hexosaminidase